MPIPRPDAAEPNRARFLLLKVLLWGAVAAFFFLIQLLTPLLADDFCTYQLMQAQLGEGTLGSWESLLNLKTLFSHTLNTIQETWNGWWSGPGAVNRFTIYFFSYLLTILPDSLFALINTFCWLLLIAGSLHFSSVSKRWYWPSVFLCVFAIFRSETCVWRSGAESYLWAAVLTLLFVKIFVSALGQRRTTIQLLWKHTLLIPIAFILAGGHELLALSTSAVLCVYWVERLIRRRFYIDGQFMLTIGFGLGSLAVLLAPVVINRAGGVGFFTPDAQLLYSVARKAAAFLRCVYSNPLILGALMLSAVILHKPTFRRRLSHADVYTIVGFFFVLASTALLTDGSGRRNWFVAISGTIAFLRLMPICVAPSVLSKRMYLTVHCVSIILTFTMLATTLAQTIVKNRSRDVSIRDWLMDENGVARLPDEPATPVGVFDRSYDSEQSFSWGEPWHNLGVAQYYGRPHLIALDKRLYVDLYEQDRLCIPSNRLNVQNRDWYADKSLDVLISPLPPNTAIPADSKIVVRYAVHPRQTDIGTRLKHRILRKGWAPFSLQNPEDEMRSEPPLPWFILPAKSGQKYLIVRHNHFIDRNNIKSIDIQASKGSVADTIK